MRFRNGISCAIAVWIALFLALISQPVAAQTTTTYANTTSGTVNATTICTAPLVRNFTVGTNFIVTDVNIGIMVEHSWRGDLQFTLQSPAGTRVQLTNGDTQNISGDNFNVLLDDSASQLVNTDGTTANHTVTNPYSPPFQHTFRPRNALSAFNGQNSAGTWRLEICDLFPQADNGTFRRANLNLTSPPANFADLSLTKTRIGSAPTNGGSVTWRLSVNNASVSTSTATGVTVRDYLPAGFTFSSATGSGTFNSSTGVWTVGSLTAGQTKTIDITGTITATAGATITNTAEITASSVADSDSTVNNGVTNEDDYATNSFTVAGTRTAGTPPTLTCAPGSTLFDWDVQSWTAGNLSGGYTLTNVGALNFTITSSGTWVNDANFGGQSPAKSNANSGGFATAQQSLHQYLDFANQSQTATTVISIPTAVSGAQFTVFDIDYAANDFADLLTVTGSYRGATVIPTLTNGVANYVIGNSAYGDATSGNTSGNGNVVVTFSQPIDTITIVYGNHSLAPADPDGQAIAIHDIRLCNAATNLSVVKASTVHSDPVNGTTNAKAVPGALVNYSIVVSNTGISSANTVVVQDNVPTDTKFCLSDLGQGPVQFTDGSPSSNLTYTYNGLASSTDHLDFSNDNGTTWTYAPTADADGCDAAITNFRVRPAGDFKGNGQFTLLARFRIR